jgi:hypothetical protein
MYSVAMNEMHGLDPQQISGIAMNETDPHIIAEQITAGIEADIETAQRAARAAASGEVQEAAGDGYFFNNFANNFPGGDTRSVIERYVDPNYPLVKESEAPARDSDGRLRHSARAREVSIAAFFADIDEGLESVGVDGAEATRLRQAYTQPASVPVEGLREVCERLGDVYHHLRSRGYSHYDLTR